MDTTFIEQIRLLLKVQGNIYSSLQEKQNIYFWLSKKKKCNTFLTLNDEIIIRQALRKVKYF